jgi:hypothetical protein
MLGKTDFVRCDPTGTQLDCLKPEFSAEIRFLKGSILFQSPFPKWETAAVFAFEKGFLLNLTFG